MCDSCGFPGATHARSFARREALSLGLGLAASLAAPFGAFAKTGKPPKPQNVLTPEQALARLKEGNARYVGGVAKRYDFVAEREALVGGQNPYAGILSCANSRDRARIRLRLWPRRPVRLPRRRQFRQPRQCRELRICGRRPQDAADPGAGTRILRRGRGGHFLDPGTSRPCPATCPRSSPRSTPAVEAVANAPGDLLVNATNENVRRNVEALKTATPILSAAVGEKRLMVVGGVYRLASGKVEMIA